MNRRRFSHLLLQAEPLSGDVLWDVSNPTRHVEVDVHDLDLSDRLRERLRDWVGMLQGGARQVADDSRTPSLPIDSLAFDVEGFRIAAELQAELGAEIAVFYFHNVDSPQIPNHLDDSQTDGFWSPA